MEVVAMEVIWDLLIFLALFAAGSLFSACWLERTDTAGSVLLDLLAQTARGRN
jgi:hypothetical protein